MSPQSISTALIVVALLLALAHLVFSLNHHYLDLDLPGETILFVVFDMTGEVTIPTWYGSSLLLLCSLLTAVLARVAQRHEGRYVRHWYGLAVIMLLLSIDEAADIHGAVSYKLQNVFDFGGALSYPWVIPGTIFVLIVAGLYLPFLASLPAWTRWQILLAGGLYVGGALGMEVIEASYDAAFIYRAPYLFMVAIEESLEMAGIIVLIVALLRYMRTLTPGVRFVVDSPAAMVDDG